VSIGRRIAHGAVKPCIATICVLGSLFVLVSPGFAKINEVTILRRKFALVGDKIGGFNVTVNVAVGMQKLNGVECGKTEAKGGRKGKHCVWLDFSQLTQAGSHQFHHHVPTTVFDAVCIQQRNVSGARRIVCKIAALFLDVLVGRMKSF